MAASTHRLLGPPEIDLKLAASANSSMKPDSGTDCQSINVATSATSVSNPFIDLMEAWLGVPFIGLMDAWFEASNGGLPLMGLTENCSPTFLSSGDACLDFFFQVVPSTTSETVTDLLSSAWEHDPLTTLKLVCQLRGVRGTGKSDKKGFYTSALWLHQHHPETLARNVNAISGFGYMKDLPEILHRLIADPDPRQKTPRKTRSCYRYKQTLGQEGFAKALATCRSCRCRVCRGMIRKVARRRESTTEERLSTEKAKVKIRVEEAATLRRRKRAEMAARAIKRYSNDPDYRLLHDKTSDFFASKLSSDLGHLKSGDTNRISLAAKWCPSLNSSYDRSTLLCETIARRVFPRDSDPEYLAVEERHYAYRVRNRLEKEVLVPLRRALELPEIYMSAGQWGSLPYSRVSSVAMKKHKKLFRKHDGDRFSEFLGLVREGKAKIAAGALLPHELVESVRWGYEDNEVEELQWRRMVSDLCETGKLTNCIAVCDVSGSMSGTPMDVCVALGLLISELSEEPWKGRVITFSESPKLHHIKGESLRDKAEFIERMEWGMNTNLQKVFDRILGVAVKGKLEARKMIKRVFVFSDMEFDNASSSEDWETDYQVICGKFQKSGYTVPEIVFWNLRDSRSTPVTSEQKGVALVSGFSKNLVKLFLESDGVLNPDDIVEEPELSPKDVMQAAIAGDEYTKLEIFD